MSNSKKKTEALDDFLRRAGVPEDKIKAEPPRVDEVLGAESDPFEFVGADVRPDLKYSQVWTDEQVLGLEDKGYVKLDTKAVDVRVRGCPGGIIMATTREHALRLKARRAQIDHERRKGRRTTEHQIHERASRQGDRFTLTTNTSPVIARGEGA